MICNRCWHEASCHLLSTDTRHRFLMWWNTSLGVTVGQMLICQWWPCGGLVCTICCNVPFILQSKPHAGLDRPSGFQEVFDPVFPGNRLMKVVRSSALCTSHLYSYGNIPGTRICLRPSRPQGHSSAGRIMSMKNWHHQESNLWPSSL